jgi:hypothetical protein
MTLHQSKKLLHQKGNNQQREETTNSKEEKFGSHTSDKELISRIHMELNI